MRKKRKKKKGVRSGSRTPLQQHMLSWETRRMLEDIRPHLCLSLPHSCITFFSSSEKVIGTTIFQSGCSISIWRGKSEVKLGQERKKDGPLCFEYYHIVLDTWARITRSIEESFFPTILSSFFHHSYAESTLPTILSSSRWKGRSRAQI